MNQEQWPDNEQWRRFAARIADGCMRAMAEGKRIVTPENRTRDGYNETCPLGAAARLPGKDFPIWSAATELNIPKWWAGDFVLGFELGSESCFYSAANRLGLAYRGRYFTSETSGE